MAMHIDQIQPGATVYGPDDEKIGEVAEVGANYLLVQKGWLFTTDIYVPFSAVSSVAQDRVVVNVTKDEIGNMDWSTPPTETFTGTSGAARDTSTTTTDTTVTTSDTAYADTTYVDTDTADTTRTAAYDTGTVSRGTVDAGEDIAVPIVEEELRIGTRQTERGGVRVDTRVEETPVEEQVTLRDETVRVERRPASGATTADVDAFQEGAFEVRETDEEAIVDKQARVVEEVVISKDVEERTETVRDTMRRTDVDVQETGGIRSTGTTRTADTDLRTGSTTEYDTAAASTTQRSGTDVATAGSSTGEAFGSARNIGGRTGETQVAETTYDTNTNASSSATRTGGDRTLTDRVEGATGLDIDRDDDVAGRPQRS